MRKIFLFLVPLLFCVFSINAQNFNAEENAAISLVSASKANLGLSADDLNNVLVSSTFFDNTSGVRRVYLIQAYKGIPVYNQMLVLAFKGDRLVSQAGSFNHSMDKLANVKTAMPSVSAESAVQSALSDRGLRATQMAVALNRKNNGQFVEFSNMGISRENITAELMWMPVENSSEMRLGWQVYIIPKTTSDYWMVRVDAVNNSILGFDNYTDYDHFGTPDVHGATKYPAFALGKIPVNSDSKNLFDFKKAEDPSLVTTATYRVIPLPFESPIHMAAPNTTDTRTDPWLAAPGNATTLKWHTGLAAADYDYTRGNNVWAYQDRTPSNNTGSIAKSASSTTAFPNLTFNFVPDFTQEPTVTTPTPNQQFNITNLFYWNNIIHDVMYIYGMDEAGGNFQDDNLGRGGAGNDHVNAEAQDGSGSNNANFSTPADGGSGRMQMYLWTAPTPDRDGDVDNGIIVHEFAHGISNRLTGGPANSGCLGNAEQMGEGWSDYYGLMFTQNWATATVNTGFNTPRGIGTYALNQPITGTGIRSQRYCTDFTINNKVYAASIPTTPHDRGEIWCATLWDMTWNIINQIGGAGAINPNIYNLAGGGGNNIALKLVTEGLKLQQCSPGFISGRNAILQADQLLYGGAYNCAIWEAFRRRGMGAFASEGSTSSVTDQVPDFTPPITLAAAVSATTIPEGSNLTYTNSVSTCSAVSNYTLRDTLPTNVSYVSGGTYNAGTRVVSFAVNQAAGSTNYPFIVNVNPGSYFAPVTLFNETVATATIPAAWTTTAPLGNVWTVSTTVANSPANSFYVQNLPADGDQRLATTNAYAIPLNADAVLSFWHRFNTEDGWDGGVVEVSTDGGTIWNDVGAGNFTLGGYNGALGVGPNNPIGGRAAFTGLQNTFINSKVSLAAYAGQSIKIRFRFGSDNNTTAPTSPEGWWVDDIVLSYKAAVIMRSSLFNASNTRVSFKDNVTEITQVVACAPTINQQPVDASVCAGTSVSYTCVGTATGGVTYQWQLSTTGIAGAYTNLANGAPYSGVTTSTLTVNPTVAGMNGYYYRCIVTGSCNPTATSNPARLSVAAASTPGTVAPATSQVCGTTNGGTITLSGHIGNVVRWESATALAGPWTSIANTTTTYTYANITQTMYYRAVVQFGTCAEAASTIATVTFAAASPMIIIADPGTTLCEGDPTLLTVYNSAGPAAVTVTQSSSNTISAGIGVSCGTAGVSTSINSYWRAYNLASFPALTGNFTINSVNFGIESLTGGTQLFTVRLYNQTGAAFPGGTRTQIASQTFNIPVQTLSIYTATFTTPPTVPNTATIIVEVEKSAVVAGQFFFPGGNAAAETGPSYISATACAINAPVTYASIGFPNTHLVMALSGTVPGVGAPVTTGTFLWTPAAGLSSTTSNPVAASPMNTTTYTVSHDNGAGCVRLANITITVNKRPAVTTQPVNTSVCSGTSASFTVGATATGITYQWQVSINGGGTYANVPAGAPYTGQTTATLNINPTTVAMNGYRYRCVISGTCPPAVNSNAGILTVVGLPTVVISPVGPLCGGVAGSFGTQLTASGASTYVWSPVTGLYLDPTAVSPYTGGNAATVYAAPTAFTAYTVTGTSTTTGCNNTATVLVNYTPPAPTVTPSSVTMCLGDPAVKLKSSSAQAFSATFNSGALSLAIPDGPATWPQTLFPGVATPNLAVSGIPANATITGMSVKLNLTHTYIADMVIVLKAPNGAVLNLDANINKTGGAGANFVNTIISSASNTALSAGAPPYTGTFRPDAAGATYTALGFTFTGGPTSPAGYIPTVSTFNGLYSVPNGNWTMGIYDWGLGDLGTLTNWELKIDYIIGVPTTPAVWTPAAGLFSDATALTPYVAGTAVDSVWTRPTPQGVYNYDVTVQSLGLPPTPTEIQTAFTNNNASGLVTSNITNNNAFPITITGIESIASTSVASTATLYYKVTPINGAPGVITAANGWLVAGTGTYTSIANTTTTVPQTMLTGLSFVIPAGATYGIAMESKNTATGVGNLRYSTVAAGTYVNSAGGVDLISGSNVSYGGAVAPTAPTFTPRAFIGKVLFSANFAQCTSPARRVVVTVNQPTTLNAALPANQTICTDKVATFSVAVTAGTGPHSYQWQVSTNAGVSFANITNGGVYSGATTATLTVTAPPVTMNGYQYRCVVTGAAPCASVTSLQRVLTVNPLPTVVITANPFTSLFPGLRTTLTSTVSPNAASTYTWIRNGATVAGATTGTLNVDVDGLGDYSLRVTDVNGCTNTSNMVTIKDSVSATCFIYPNPTEGKFQVRYYSVANNILPRTLTVYDAKGDRVLTQRYAIGRPYDRMDVDMRAYGKGLYWVEIGDKNGSRLTMCRVAIQ